MDRGIAVREEWARLRARMCCYAWSGRSPFMALVRTRTRDLASISNPQQTLIVEYPHACSNSRRAAPRSMAAKLMSAADERALFLRM